MVSSSTTSECLKDWKNTWISKQNHGKSFQGQELNQYEVENDGSNILKLVQQVTELRIVMFEIMYVCTVI